MRKRIGQFEIEQTLANNVYFVTNILAQSQTTP